jgi:hypothetical protein
LHWPAAGRARGGFFTTCLMPGIDGFGVVGQLAWRRHCPVTVVRGTAYDQRTSLRAFEAPRPSTYLLQTHRPNSGSQDAAERSARVWFRRGRAAAASRASAERISVALLCGGPREFDWDSGGRRLRSSV